MHIKINRPTEQGISFALEYLDEERDELPYYGPLTRRGVSPVFLNDLRNGKLDNNDYDIDLHPFNWNNYLIIKRYLDMMATREANPMARMSRELGLSRDSYTNLFKTHVNSSYVPLFVPNKNPKKTKHGGKKRRIRARRTHRRRA
jgi:hypothetical protein